MFLIKLSVVCLFICLFISIFEKKIDERAGRCWGCLYSSSFTLLKYYICKGSLLIGCLELSCNLWISFIVSLHEQDPKKPSAHLEGANRGDVSYKANEGKS